jgi:two-component system, OmpR family, response regulator ChvI
MGLPEEGEAGPIRILIVEDDENYREIVSSELAWHGFAVSSFANGDALLGSLEVTAEADVIVLDWRLPTISGIDLLLQLRKRSVNVPMVFLTSHTQPANQQLAFEGSVQNLSHFGRWPALVKRSMRCAA